MQEDARRAARAARPSDRRTRTRARGRRAGRWRRSRSARRAARHHLSDRVELRNLRLGVLQPRDHRVGIGRPRADRPDRAGERIGGRDPRGGAQARGRPVRAVAPRQHPVLPQEPVDLRGGVPAGSGAVPLDLHGTGRRERLERDERVVARDQDLEPARRLRRGSRDDSERCAQDQMRTQLLDVERHQGEHRRTPPPALGRGGETAPRAAPRFLDASSRLPPCLPR